MSWLVSTRQYIPAVIGEAWGGGYFAGYISHTADGNPTHALIVAPRATGATGTGYTLTTNLAWALNQNAGNGTNYSTTTIGATTPSAAKDYDGQSNMALMTAIGISNFPAAEFCKNLTINGYTDWYLPARYELDIAYFNLKPGTAVNHISSGANVYAVPRRPSNWNAASPMQALITQWQQPSGDQRFELGSHRASTEILSNIAFTVNFTDGMMETGALSKVNVGRVRAFRKIAL